MSDHSLCQEFQSSRFGFRHEAPTLFTTSQWTSRAHVYLVWRLAWAVVMLVLTGLALASGLLRVNDDPNVKWFLALGHWAVLLCPLVAVLDLINVIITGCSEDRPDAHTGTDGMEHSSPDDEVLFCGEFTLIKGFEQSSLPLLTRVVWLLYDVTNSWIIVWCLVFWLVDFDNDNSNVMDIVCYSINPCLIVANIMVTAAPVILLHFIYPVIAAIIYVFFTLIYHLSGGEADMEDIFPGVDWDEAFPTALTLSLGLTLALPLGHLVTFALFTFRLYLFSRLQNIGQHESESHPTRSYALDPRHVQGICSSEDHEDHDGLRRLSNAQTSQRKNNNSLDLTNDSAAQEDTAQIKNSASRPLGSTAMTNEGFDLDPETSDVQGSLESSSGMTSCQAVMAKPNYGLVEQTSF